MIIFINGIGKEKLFPKFLNKDFLFDKAEHFELAKETGSVAFAPRLVFGGSGPVPLQSLNPAAMSTTDFALNNPSGPFNNLGVPGAASFHLLANGYGSLANFPAAANPYAIRIAGNTDASILELAMAQSPSFFARLIG